MMLSTVRLACAILAVGMSGCGSGVKTVRAWGDVTWQRVPVKDGVIVFFPIEGTAGPSTGGEIVAGRYDVPAAKGPRAGGAYRVEITAYGPVRLYSPDVGATAPAVPVREQIIPRRFNIETSLRSDVRDDPDGHRQDFLLE
jgi:hypothetical protein